MKNHSLIVNAQTTPSAFDRFLWSAHKEHNPDGNLHLRAYETTYSSPGGQPCTVKVLFIRSGRETLFEWFRNTWNRESQYALAAEVLHEVGGFETGTSSVSGPRYQTPAKPGSVKEVKTAITVSSLLKDVVPCSTKRLAVPLLPAHTGHLQTRPISDLPNQANQGFSLHRLFTKLFTGSRS